MRPTNQTYVSVARCRDESYLWISKLSKGKRFTSRSPTVIRLKATVRNCRMKCDRPGRNSFVKSRVAESTATALTS